MRVLSRQEWAEVSKNIIATYIQTHVTSLPKLLETVAAGEFHWRTTMLRELRGFAVNDDIANHAFRFLQEEAKRQTKLQLNAEGMAPGEVLDQLEVTTPPTEREIADAWEVESASSDAGRRSLYGDRHPKEVLDRLITEER